MALEECTSCDKRGRWWDGWQEHDALLFARLLPRAPSTHLVRCGAGDEGGVHLKPVGEDVQAQYRQKQRRGRRHQHAEDAEQAGRGHAVGDHVHDGAQRRGLVEHAGEAAVQLVAHKAQPVGGDHAPRRRQRDCKGIRGKGDSRVAWDRGQGRSRGKRRAGRQGVGRLWKMGAPTHLPRAHAPIIILPAQSAARTLHSAT